MMPVIRIPDSVYERLQKHATPFVDTPATVIERLLNAFESGGAVDQAVKEKEPKALARFIPGDPMTGEEEDTVEVGMTSNGEQDGYDVLGGRVGSRTNAIHSVLIDAARKHEVLKAAVIAERAQSRLPGGSAHPAFAKLPSTVGSHLNTMRTRGYVTNDGKGYYLTNTARQLAGLPPVQRG